MNLPKLGDLPHNVEAEQAVLGSIMVNNLTYHAVSDLLKVEHFVDPMHGAIFDAAGKLIGKGMEANPFSLKAYVETLPGLKEAGGAGYLAKLLATSVHTSDATTMARIVRDAALRRGLVGIATEAMAEACKPLPEDSAADQIGRVEKRLYDLAEGNVEGDFRTFGKGLVSAVEGADAAHKRRGKLSGVTTGLRSLDRLLGGLHNSDLLILAGRPSMGKTALATNIATAAATAHRTAPDEHGEMVTVDGARVGFISLEMSTEQLVTRIVADKADVSSDKVRKGELNAAEWDRLLDASRTMEELPLYIDDTPAQTLSMIRTRARRLKRKHGCELIVIDYLQLIEPDEKRRNGNRVEDVSAITKGLKALAKELNVPVLALSQLSRAVETRSVKRPQLSDLRESGSIEQDADVVMFVYREEYYLERSPEKDTHKHIESMGKAEIMVEKQRHGPIGTVTTRFQAALTRFTDMEAGA